jgi:hypothetical protein
MKHPLENRYLQSKLGNGNAARSTCFIIYQNDISHVNAK